MSPVVGSAIGVDEIEDGFRYQKGKVVLSLSKWDWLVDSDPARNEERGGAVPGVRAHTLWDMGEGKEKVVKVMMLVSGSVGRQRALEKMEMRSLGKVVSCRMESDEEKRNVVKVGWLSNWMDGTEYGVHVQCMVRSGKEG